MSAAGVFLFSLFVHLTILSGYVGIVFASPCIRVPQSTGAGKSNPTGNFGITISSNSDYYQPGRQYTISISRKSFLSNREGSKPKFIGFFLVIERKSTPPSEYAEEFSPAIHGKLLVDDSYQSFVRLSCGNVATHYLDTPKSEIQVNWTAPEPGAGALSFRATIIETRDVWYMDGIFLSKDLEEDADAQDDYLSNVLPTCCACNEAKYELSFEGLWSKHTHPKNFPNNEFGARFGDIIGATHKFGSHFWASGNKASNGFKDVAETGETERLEQELKDMGGNIRTIIKARGLAHPNITTKTLAVFRVDSENHLVSFVSPMRPSPDWFVGVSALELCQETCDWVETKVLYLYPWDAGTADGTSYEDGKPLGLGDAGRDRREFIRRITSDWPASKNSPFYDENGTKMKPLARLTLSRQRLYEKNCDGDDTDNESIFNDQDCDDAVSSSSWGPCLPNCKRTADETGTQTRTIRYKSLELQGMCEQKYFQRTRDCDIQVFCVGQDQAGQEYVPTRPDEQGGQYQPGRQGDQSGQDWQSRQDGRRGPYGPGRQGEQDGRRGPYGPGRQGDQDGQRRPGDDDQYETTTAIGCTYVKTVSNSCDGICGVGQKITSWISKEDPINCPPRYRSDPCILQKTCKNEDFCRQTLDPETCRKPSGNVEDKGPTNLIFYNATSCMCTVFTTYCVLEEKQNIFDSFKSCTDACNYGPDNCRTRIPSRNKNSLV